MSQSFSENSNHNEHAWIHAVCDVCYFQRAPQRGLATIPGRTEHVESPLCCYCGQTSHGIYIRDNPQVVHGTEVSHGGQVPA